MAPRVLDTSVLLRWWNRCRSGHKGPVTEDVAESWGRRLTEVHQTTAIVTPVLLEIVGGATSARELSLIQAFLRPFSCIDEQRVLPADWREALRLAQRIPQDRTPRQLGDCLIAAVARRLKRKVETFDKGFPK